MNEESESKANEESESKANEESQRKARGREGESRTRTAPSACPVAIYLPSSLKATQLAGEGVRARPMGAAELAPQKRIIPSRPQLTCHVASRAAGGRWGEDICQLATRGRLRGGRRARAPRGPMAVACGDSPGAIRQSDMPSAVGHGAVEWSGRPSAVGHGAVEWSGRPGAIGLSNVLLTQQSD